jgi:hypothetical protein
MAMPEPPEAPGSIGPLLDSQALSAVATLWIAQLREIRTRFSGDSMRPAIAPGQEVMVRCGAHPSIGDVVVYRVEQALAVHRLVADGGAWLLTWGDANPLPDEPFDKSALLGAVVGVERAGAMSSVPTFSRSLWQRALLFGLVPSGAPRERVAARVRLIHRMRHHARGGAAHVARRAWARLRRMAGGAR